MYKHFCTGWLISSFSRGLRSPNALVIHLFNGVMPLKENQSRLKMNYQADYVNSSNCVEYLYTEYHYIDHYHYHKVTWLNSVRSFTTTSTYRKPIIGTDKHLCNQQVNKNAKNPCFIFNYLSARSLWNYLNASNCPCWINVA